MTINSKAPLELSKLSIDRSPAVKKTLLSVNYTGMFILTLLCTSLYIGGQSLFYSPSAAEVITKTQTSKSRFNGLTQPDIQQYSPLAVDSKKTKILTQSKVKKKNNNNSSTYNL